MLFRRSQKILSWLFLLLSGKTQTDQPLFWYRIEFEAGQHVEEEDVAMDRDSGAIILVGSRACRH